MDVFEFRVKLMTMSALSFLLFAPDLGQAAGHLLAGGGGGALFSVSTGASLETKALATPHSKAVYALAGRGELLLSGDMGGGMARWSLMTGQSQSLEEGHRGAVRSIAFSPDGTLVATASRDRTIRIWNVPDMALLQTLEGHKSYVYDARFSPDGAFLASVGSDNTLLLWDTAAWKELRAIPAHYNAIYAVRFSPDGRFLATCSADKFIKLWKTEDLSAVWEVQGHEKGVYDLAFSPDGATLVSVGADKAVRIWDVPTGAALRAVDIPEAVGLNAVLFDPAGSLIHVGDESGLMLSIDIQAGAVVARGKAGAAVKALALVP